jgi:hypothetical protein
VLVVAAFREWTVLPHDPLEQIADNVWRVEGDIPDMKLVRRVMTVVRTTDGRLVIHNAIALDEPNMRALEALGEPYAIIVPNGWHRLDAPSFCARYPALQVYCPAKAAKAVDKVVPVTGDYEGFRLGPQVQLRYLPGVKAAEGVMEARSQDGVTLVFNDLLNNLPRLPGFVGWTYGLFAGTGRPGVHRFVGRMLVRDRTQLREDLLRQAARPELQRVIVSHGAAVLENAPGFLRQIAERL